MAVFGYAISSEEHAPADCVRHAKLAEEHGFEFISISDHYHPWIDFQGHSPFVWSVIGAISQVTREIPVMTGVTCPIMRIHPAVLAQAAATTASLLPGRFWFGIGTGEALNEHITGEHWPQATVRLDMLEEAVEIIRLLWQGDESTYFGDYFTVENARLYTLPKVEPPIYMAASGSLAAGLAADLADGLVSTSPDAELFEIYRSAGGEGKPIIAKMTVCYAEDEEEALETAYRWWPTSAIPGALHADLPTPAHFEQAARLVHKEDVMQGVIIGPKPERHIEEARKFLDAGATHLYFHQVGPDQEDFMRFFAAEILPELRQMQTNPG